MLGRRQRIRQPASTLIKPPQFNPIPRNSRVKPRHFLKPRNHIRGRHLALGSRIQRQLCNPPRLRCTLDVGSFLARRIASLAEVVENGQRAHLVARIESRQGCSTFGSRGDVLHRGAKHRDFLAVGTVSLGQFRNIFFLRLCKFRAQTRGFRNTSPDLLLQLFDCFPLGAELGIREVLRSGLCSGSRIECGGHLGFGVHLGATGNPCSQKQCA